MKKNKQMKFYVAYGSNMNIEQMRYRCKDAENLGLGYLCGYRLVFNIHANIEKTNREQDVVPVLVWKISKTDETCLDVYEGYPNYYIKKNVDVILEGEIISAMVYIMTDKKGWGRYSFPSESYFYGILDGYKDCGASIDYLYDSLERTEKLIGAK